MLNLAGSIEFELLILCQIKSYFQPTLNLMKCMGQELIELALLCVGGVLTASTFEP